MKFETTAYEKPTLTALGTVEDMTHGASAGSELDNDFPTGTDFGDLTFS
ncbi:lasso RiPP family leader peptide-containing protein [Marivita sp.]|nr:lasso RiPP family leader peptide-containing protein [Marivita sp.]